MLDAFLKLVGFKKANTLNVESTCSNIDESEDLDFEWITKKWVRSNKGYEVKSLGRYNMEYCDKNLLTLKLKCDFGFTEGMKPCVIVSSSEFSRAGLRQGEVMGNFVAAMEFQNMAVAFE